MSGSAGSQVKATVTQATPPVMVRADGADTACPASVDPGITVVEGSRVSLTLQTPEIPRITALVED